MTVETTDRKQTYAGGQNSLTFSFRALTTAPSDIKVLKTLISSGAETVLTYASDYTVAVNSDGVGGIVTMTPSVSTLYTTTVYRETTDKQESDYDDFNQFPADTIEEDLDRRTMISQERSEESGRTVQLPISSSGVSTTLPVPAANQILSWNSSADALENVNPADLNFISVSTDTSLGTADDVVPSQNAVKTYADTKVTGDGTVNPTNLLSNGDFESWSAGASAAPDGWAFAGAGASIAREATIIKLGTYSAKLTRAGADCYITQTFHTSKGINYWKGRTVTISCWVYATVADRAFVYVYDGVGAYSSTKHTGDSTWQLLTKTFTVDASATTLTATFYIQTGDTSAYFDGAICVEGSSAFAFSPKPAEEGVWADYSAVSTIVGWASFTTKQIYTKRIGKTVFVQFALNGTSNATGITFTLPYQSAGVITMYAPCGYQKDNNTALDYPSLIKVVSGTSTCTVYKSNTASSAASWTESGTKYVYGQFFYEAA